MATGTTSQYIGTTACDECGTRFKVSNKHKDRIGHPTRCPKCKSIFTVELIESTPLEQASIENSNEVEESAQEARKKRRRSKTQIRQDTIDAIGEGFKQLHPRLVQISESKRSSEEEIRHWCVEVLKTALRYEDNDIAIQVPTLGKYADIVLKKNGKVFLVIECKSLKSKLNTNVRHQAANYATSLSTEWIVVTNGQVWKLYRLRIRPGQDPHFIEIFDVALLDEDGVSESDAENLYLLTPRAVFGGDLEKRSHEVACLTKKRIDKALESERVIKALRLELVDGYKEEHDHNVNLDDQTVSDALQEALGLSEL
ncbi:MAG: type I restriction enzyme HsdR N-terminal domain-containing protein [Cyanobacteria bacterium]|nr:type I restriction enzyme HsdR N-terminal domain-containing protein [Cyanobacteriota bacterium]MDA0866943.1 type I restriction enzyme HsdR N-terminal domain-containing protein [Cyanobacteriota bacterium]